MINVALDQTPLENTNAGRGVGSYTRGLLSGLQTSPEVEVINWENKSQSQLWHYPYFDLFFTTLPFFSSKPRVVTVHDVIPLLFPKEYAIGFKGWLKFWYQRWALKRVQAVITDSEASKRDIQKYLKIPHSKIFVTYLAANPAIQPQPDKKIEQVKKKYHIEGQYLLYVGDINYNKNLPQLIKSLKFLPDEIKLVCVGKNFKPQPIPEWQVIETQVALSNVATKIVFINDLETTKVHDLAALYTGALVYVQPSLAEGFGLPVLEAMQAGTPVICAQNSSLIEVGGGAATLVQPEAEIIAEAVENILNWTPERRQEVIKAGQTWAATFTWKKTTQATISVYKQVLHQT